MTVIVDEIRLNTKAELDLVDITPVLRNSLSKTGLEKGTATVFIPGATGAITTIEFEPGLQKDFPAALERLFPKDIRYWHHDTWHDDNGHSHVRAAMLSPSLTIPFTNGTLILGTWQQIIFVELDTRGRTRHISVTFIGE
ncbi:MAG: secondary thiamine-phosphate synthase enzyme YjbQ [Candidatus Heimdallarchaeota archaeon]